MSGSDCSYSIRHGDFSIDEAILVEWNARGSTWSVGYTNTKISITDPNDRCDVLHLLKKSRLGVFIETKKSNSVEAIISVLTKLNSLDSTASTTFPMEMAVGFLYSSVNVKPFESRQENC